MSHFKGFPDLPPLWWAGSIVFIYLAKWALPSWHFEANVMTLLSRIIFYGALTIIVWAAVWFWLKKTPIEPHHTPEKLIVEGPYRLSRNPIYLGLILLTLASALGNGSVVGLGCTVALWLILDQRFAAKEEALMIETFQEDAHCYLSRTRRWL